MGGLGMNKFIKHIWHSIRESFKEPDISDLFVDDDSKTDIPQAVDRLKAEVNYQASKLVENYGSIDKAEKGLDKYWNKIFKEVELDKKDWITSHCIDAIDRCLCKMKEDKLDEQGKEN